MRRLYSAVLPQMLAVHVQRRSLQFSRAASAARDSIPGRKPWVPAAARLPAPVVDQVNTSDGDLAEWLQLRQLEAALSHHSDVYYNQQRSEISDAAYDNLKRQYRQLTGRLQGLAPEEVSLPVGAPAPSAGPLRKVYHRVPMLSLAAVNSREEAEVWLQKLLAKLLPNAASTQSTSNRSSRRSRRRKGKAANSSDPAIDGAAIAATATTPGQPYRWVVEPKVDGLAVRALYRRTADGKYRLEEAATRGDGAVGEDVTHNALHGGISGLPPTLAVEPPWSSSGSGDLRQRQQQLQPPGAQAGCPEWVDMRGEVFVRTADLELVNREQEAAGQPPFANARNAASGAIRLLDSAECRRRRLSFVAYAALAPAAASSPSLPSSPSPPPSSHSSSSSNSTGGASPPRPLHPSQWETLQWLQETGFAVNPDNQLCDSVGEALASAEAWMAQRGSLGYDADGAVIKLDDTTLYDTLGTTGSDPRWAVAWKFPAEEAVTRLAEVELTVGRQGQITPVALLEPVALGGVTIRRATLHNVGLAAAMDLHLGDALVLRRSGDVIPQVVRVLPELRPASALPWRAPSACPACGGLVRLLPAANKGSGDQLVCASTDCGAKSERKLRHFASVCLKGSNVSKGIVRQLMASELIRELPDFYRLDQNILAALPGFGPARIATLLASLESSRRISAATLLCGLNIRLVGETAATALGRAFPRLEDLAAASPKQISEVAGVGPAVAGSVAAWFQRPDNQALLQRLKRAGLLCIAGAPAPSAATATAASPRAAGMAGAAGTSSTGLTSADGGNSFAAPGRSRRLATDARGPVAGQVQIIGGQRQQQQLLLGQESGKAQEARAGEGTGPRLVGVAGLRVCVTGIFTGPRGTKLVRSELKRMMEEAGAEFHPTLRKDTQFLLVGGDAGGRKTAKAAASGVRTMGEGEFWGSFWSEGEEDASPDPEGGDCSTGQ